LAVEALYFVIPGDIDTKTGGYIYDRRLIGELRKVGWQIDHVVWPSAFPFPSPQDKAQAAASLSSMPDGSIVLIDGLAYGALHEQVAAEAWRLRLVALCHHPLALESGLSEEATERLRQSEKQAFESARLVIATSATTADCLRLDYGVPPNRIAVAKPGIDRPDGPRQPGAVPRLLSVGTVTPRKNHEALIRALSQIADLDWQCDIAGSLTRAPETAETVRRLIETLGLQDRIALLGEVADTAPLYRQADIFVLPSLHEGYGMVLGEALANGLPIVASRVGAVAEVVPASGGILVQPGDCGSLSTALRLLIADKDERARLARGAVAAGQSLHGWDGTALCVSAALNAL
jgi:glycosyltransferase involved in cell wall biosynthesis